MTYNYKKYRLPWRVAISLLLFTVAGQARAQEMTLRSPSGNMKLTVNNGKKLSYHLKMDGKLLFKDSPLGFSFKNEPDMGSGLLLLSKQTKAVDNRWMPVLPSKHRVVHDRYRALALELVEKEGLRRRMDLEFRAYDDGLAFRYRLFRSEQSGDRLMTNELTGFHLAGDAKAWIADYKGYVSPQESDFRPRQLSSVPDTVRAGLPFLIAVDNSHYAAITEAQIDNYPGFYMGIKRDGDGGISLSTKLSPLPMENEDGVKARFSDKLYTPWRVVLLGRTPGSLIESDLVQNLNPPCVLKDISWIKPGISAWDNWWSGDVKMEMPVIKKYIDFAAAQGWPYMIVDWQWYGAFNKPEADITKAAPQLNMPALLAYAREKKVKLWLWLYSSDVNRNNNFEKAFALYEKWGIAGVKIDFMNRDDQEMVNWYHDIIRRAASHHLMVDFHGAYKPDGIIRTWPNMITREGVMGNEYNKFSDRLVPEHNVTLPFTRMLAGQMDYTPGGFINVTPSAFKQTLPTEVMNTRCAELAKFVIYESPLTVDCESPDHVLGQPGADFLKQVPTVWDDVHVLSGYPGEHIALVRRNGKRFFIGAMTNSERRVIKLPLNFLPPGRYVMTSWNDADDADRVPAHLKKMSVIVTASSIHTITMAVGGGFAAILAPIKN